MAQVKNGSFRTYGYNGGGYPDHYVFSWELISQSIEGNYSEIKWSLSASGGATSGRYTIVKEKYVTVNGETQSNKTEQQTFNGTTPFSGTAKIYHDVDGNKSFSASAGGAFFFYGSYNTTGSGTWELPSIPRYATSTQSLKSKTETTITINWSSDNIVDYLWYSTDWGTTWKEAGSVNASSGAYTISTQSRDNSSLAPNTTYNVITRVRRKDSQLTTNSSNLAVTTYDYPHCTNMPNFTIGNGVNLTFYNPLNRTFRITVYGNNDKIILEDNQTGTTRQSCMAGETSVANLYASIPNTKSATYKVKVTYGSSVITKTGGTYSIKGTEKPTVGSITYADTNTTVTAITGNNQHIVQNQSNLKVTFASATPKNSATISKHTFVLNGVTKESTSASGTVDFGKINSSNNLTLTVTVTDSRGLTTSTTKTITMLSYSNPNAIVTLERLNNYEDETYLTVDGSVSSVNSKNTIAIKYRYKVSGGNYGSFTNIGDRVQQTLSLDKNNAYIFNVVVTDAFGSTYNKEHVLGKGVFPLFIDTVKNSVGINCFPNNENTLEVKGNIIQDGWVLNANYSGTVSGGTSYDFELLIGQFSDVDIRLVCGTSAEIRQLITCNYTGYFTDIKSSKTIVSAFLSKVERVGPSTLRLTVSTTNSISYVIRVRNL